MNKPLVERIESLKREIPGWSPAKIGIDAILADVRELVEALGTLAPILAEWHAEFPNDIGDKEWPALSRAWDILRKVGGE